ncbi:MAG: F0F1 ATP synthase subunit beta, partial [Candidatus Zophobacter franzmannii]|nr:F0F1 ATP synthase subunit beta [Candidatus Zophobacter franzmannii]
MTEGIIKQIMSAVIDVEFPEGQLPKIYNALKVIHEDREIILETQMHLGENKVRAISMDTTDGLTRGMTVFDTGEPITMPVGEEVLGRIINVTGKPIDKKGEIKTATRMPIHRAAPSFDSLSTEE